MAEDALTRRGLIAAAGTLAAAATVASPTQAAGAIGSGITPDGAFPRALGSGGRPTSNETLARLAREHGKGEPVMFVDLAAIDQNAKVIVDFARAHRWHVRPALKVFQSPKLCAYILHLLPRAARIGLPPADRRPDHDRGARRHRPPHGLPAEPRRAAGLPGFGRRLKASARTG